MTTAIIRKTTGALWRKRNMYLSTALLAFTVLIHQGLGLKDHSSEGVRRRGKAGASARANKMTISLRSIPLKQRLPTTLEHLMAGTLGGMSGALVSYPLDTVRVRVQTAEKHLSPLRMASDLLREAGLAGFYRGVASPVAGAALITSSVFGGYGLFQSIVRGVRGKDGQELTLGETATAGSGAGLVSAFVITPIERIKVMMQAAATTARLPPSVGAQAEGAMSGAAGAVRYSNTWSCARGLVEEQGLVRGLYAGLNPTLLREVPAYAIYFLTYEYLKRLLARKGDNDRSSAGITMLKTAISGGVAGMASWLPIYPIDVVKSKIQVVAGEGPGMLETATQLWRTEGLRPFSRGLAPTLARAMIYHAYTFVVYEATMSLIMRRSSDAGVQGVAKSA